MNRFRYILTILALAFGASCTEDITDIIPIPEPGEEMSVPISISVAPETGSLETRSLASGLTESSIIQDIWIIEYNQADGSIVGIPRYYEASELGTGKTIPVIMPPKGATYIFVGIANTHKESLGSLFSTADKFSKIDDIAQTISSMDNLYQKAGSSHDFLMSGRTDITNYEGSYYEVNASGVQSSSPLANLPFKLFRNIAKLSLKVSNDTGSGVTVQSVQIRNVPNKVFYADWLKDYSYAPAADQKNINYYTTNPAPDVNEVSLFEYPIEECVLAPGQSSTEFTYYLPRNCRGQAQGSSSVADKNAKADRYATFVEVMAEVGGEPFRYRFYLGEDMVDDCNVMPNHHYSLTIKITKPGNPDTDSRVEDMGRVILGEANSYIINPLAGKAQSVYSLPASKRSNRYWGTLKGGAGGQIDANSEWEAEVIWQDSPKRLIHFSNEAGTELYDTYSRKGTDPLGDLFFKPTGEHGNVVIGIKKKGSGYEDYLWSWHLWITDYAPNERREDWDNRYIYPVSGGEVHRYHNGLWGGTYQNKYMMDRNLGALEVQSNYVYHVTGLLYQYGRKDPFPLFTTTTDDTILYDIDGSDIKGKKAYANVTNLSDYVITKSNGTYDKSIHNPHVYYVYEIQTEADRLIGDWCIDNPYNGSSVVWNNPQGYRDEMVAEGNNSDKSLFDPCPEGWKIPHIDAWRHTFKNEWTEEWKNVGTWKDIDGINAYISPVKEIGAPTTYYPLPGYRNYDGPKASAYVNKYGAYWSSTALSGKQGMIMNINEDRGDIRFVGDGRSFGVSVRCIQE